ncbi:MAG: peptide-N-glycosidase F-related protein, partial [Planctomycetota bacterium]
MTRLLAALLCILTTTVFAQPHLSRFAEGGGPTHADGVYKLLDAAGTNGQSNAVALDRAEKGAFETTALSCKLRVLKGGDGGAFVFLNTSEYGARGPAPFVKSWVEPSLKRTFAVGIDVHNPKNEEPFGPWGNYLGNPEREISLHWDGREIVKRVAPVEFRGDWADCNVTLQHVVGGAEVTVALGGKNVYDRYFIPGLLPYESRLAIGAATRADAATEFDVKDVRFERKEPAKRRRIPKHFEIFNHVLTNNSKTAYESEVTLPPASWEFGRVILTLEIHDAGPDWDEWDRNGEISVFDKDGKKRGIVPFITSYRTECHWKVDVTHFRPWLSDKTKFEVRAGTTFYKNRGYMMSVSLDYYHGRPELEAYRVEPVWTGTAKYKSAENHFSDFFEPREIAIDAEARAARLFVSTTGHSQVGEFTPSARTVIFRGDKDADATEEQRFDNTLWKADCYLNPNRPQFGTWKYARAGWAPGDVVWPWWIDLSGWLQPGKTAALGYEPHAYDFGDDPRAPKQKAINQASHVVRAYLILYRAPAGMMRAPSLQITGVAKNSNAAKAGIKRGDYMASYDGKPVNSLNDLRAAIGEAAKAEKIPGAWASISPSGSGGAGLLLDPAEVDADFAHGPERTVEPAGSLDAPGRSLVRGLGERAPGGVDARVRFGAAAEAPVALEERYAEERLVVAERVDALDVERARRIRGLENLRSHPRGDLGVVVEIDGDGMGHVRRGRLISGRCAERR